MKQKGKKTISVLLAVLMVLAMLPDAIMAHASDVDYSFSAESGELRIENSVGVKDWESVVSPADIKKLVISGSVSKITGDVFQGLINLESVVFEGTVEIQAATVGSSIVVPFAGTVNLKTISFGGDAILGQDVFRYTQEEPNTALTELYFPMKTEFSSYNFSYCNELQKIVFEDNALIKSGGSFCGVPKLKTIEFRSESEIGSGNFQGAINIETMIFGKKTSIGGGVFSGCLKLKELTFPDGSTLGPSIFAGNTALEKITFEGDVDLTAGGIFSGSTGLKTLIFKGESIISNGAFGGSSNLESISFGGKTDIRGGMFQVNSQLKELTFPTGSTIGSSVFSGFTALEKITFEGDVDLTAGGIFSGSTGLKTLIFKGESKISNSAFSGSNNLESISFAGKTDVSNGVFSGNSKLKELTFPTGSIFNAGVFGGFTALEKITFEGDVDLAAGGIFQGTSGLKTLIFKGESKISNSAFSGSSNLESISFGGKTDIRNGVFYGNSKLKELIFPTGSTFGYSIFMENPALEKVTFEGDVDLTAGGVFQGNIGLKTLIFNGESRLANSSFQNAVNLKEIYFAKKTELGSGAFSNIGTELADKTDVIVLPDGSTVGTSAFYESNLSGVEFKALVPQTFNRDVLSKCKDGAVIYVPCVSTQAYTTALNEGQYPANPQNFAIKGVHTIDTKKYVSDINNHWNKCSNCDEHLNKATHTAGDWITDIPATQTANGTKHKECIVCQYKMETGIIPATGSSSEHTHKYSNWNSNSEKHWKECSCGDKTELTTHSFEWIIDKDATNTTVGKKHEECTVCGYKKAAVEIPEIGNTDDTTNSPKPGENSPQTGDNSNMFLWFVLLLISGGAAIGTTVVNKKKKYHR